MNDNPADRKSTIKALMSKIDEIKSGGYSADFVQGFEAGVETASEVIRLANEVEEQDDDRGE